ncbi:MAG TPA: VTT domain-containing protein [Anaerolineaceae bacterium]
MNPKLRTNLVRGATLLFVIVLTVFLILNRDQVKHFGQYGYPGVFIVALLTNATVILPMPTLILTGAMATIFNPFWVAIVTAAGASIGELTGYLAGFSGRGVVENKGIYLKLEQWIKKYGDLTIFILAFLPLPFMDMAGITAGVLKMPVYRYLFWCFLGKALKMLLVAYFGFSLEGWIPKL